MQIITLANIPNQSFSVTLDNNNYDIAINETNGVMALTLSRNNVVVISGSRLAAGSLVLPYKYQEDGNFYVSTLNDDYPYYDQFGITQFLLYFSQTELDETRSLLNV